MSPRPTPLWRIVGFALTLLTSGAFSPAVHAANDMVIRINGIAGESTVAGHVGDIDVLSFSWSVNSTRSLSGGTATVANASYLTFTKRVDKASPTLMVGVFSGQHITTAILYVRNQNGTALDFFKITLTDVVVNSYNTSAASDGSLIESVSISFATIKFDYQSQNSDGTANGGVISAGWNVTQNKAQ